ncbi:PAS domain-containing protein [Helicobacter cetorum]|uniref:Methyl-accepting chemotaxis protein n=1 Tax=Helicobacter cetorum (strain ATCC BAA-540 / CCUG 52418 / MIT 99-5656) TaxID=1163745 RepID=I0EQM1_HELCM|nr:PAS domain-containing protein [Helicobacter cetorum]AFI05240.1 methyl-accepting chemotaxis protein [Helicobacter cetorum MIT 99-5656]
MERFVDEEGFLVSKTTTRGVITYANESFVKIVGAKSMQDLLGKPHNIIRHADMPKIAFKYLWDTIQAKNEANVFVKNVSLDKKDFYWVFANITPSLDMQGNIVGYYSVRRKPNPKGVSEISKIYQRLLECEHQANGVALAQKTLEGLLKENNTTLDALMNALQNS